jgi:endonuclease/exonuclease/phosphatase family metal-dependent hydrolase
MRIVTYNLHFGGKGRVHWNEIIEEFSPEILMVQESYAPEEHLSPLLHGMKHQHAVWSPVESKGKTLKWGSGAYFPSHGPQPINLPNFTGWVVGGEIAEFRCPDGNVRRLRAFSLHAPSGVGTYQKVVNAILDMLLDQRDDCEVIIGGDFNLSVSERHESEERVTTKADLKIQTRLCEEFGLINCWQTANKDQPLPQTLRWVSDRTVPYHCDGLFVPASWAQYLQSCSVLSSPKWDDLSDHNPVVAEFT